jgi:hypothetical protein
MPRRRIKGAAAVVERMARDPKRGDVYWFLWDEHDAILAQTQGKPIPWKAILKDIQALGLTNGNGQPVTNEEALGRTWRRVCADKRREAEAKQQRAAERRRPTNDPPPVVARTVAPAPAPVPAPAHQPPAGPVPFQIKIVPREVIEEEARQAYERRPDLFPHGPDILRYKILKESGKRL